METVKLVDWTIDPIGIMYWAWQNMHNPIDPDGPSEPIDEKTKRHFLKVVAKIPHQSVLEYVKLTFYINGSRAFQQQLTRSRKSVFSIQSLRIVNAGAFAEEKNYHTQPEADIPEYHEAMLAIQKMYNELTKVMPVEAARGILPLNINSPITWSVNLRELVHILELRFCKNAQYEFRIVASKIKQLVAEKIDPDIAAILFRPHCQQFGYCNSPAPCNLVTELGRYHNIVPTRNIGKLGLKS